MAVHSMCQPGRPGPNGLSHDGSPGRSPRHSEAVERVLLALAVGVSPALGEDLQHLPSRSQPETAPKAGSAVTEK